MEQDVEGWSLYYYFIKVGEITMCLLADGNNPVERKRSDGAAVKG